MMFGVSQQCSNWNKETNETTNVTIVTYNAIYAEKLAIVHLHL